MPRYVPRMAGLPRVDVVPYVLFTERGVGGKR